MNLLDIRSQLEEELTWRLNEIRFLKNQISNLRDEEDRKRYRKSLVVMLYSHFEGFCRTCFLIYVQAINNESLQRSRLNSRLRAASLADVFRAYGNKDKKSKIFKNTLPSDEKLHEYSRQVDVVEAFDDLLSELAQIPENVVDTESNLKPVVLRKILFRLGFPHDAFGTSEGMIDMLLNHRNNVAHGARVHGLSEQDYDKVEKATTSIMTEVVGLIFNALDNKEFLKSS